jgi:hypothetical protein
MTPRLGDSKQILFSVLISSETKEDPLLWWLRGILDPAITTSEFAVSFSLNCDINEGTSVQFEFHFEHADLLPSDSLFKGVQGLLFLCSTDEAENVSRLSQVCSRICSSAKICFVFVSQIKADISQSLHRLTTDTAGISRIESISWSDSELNCAFKDDLVFETLSRIVACSSFPSTLKSFRIKDYFNEFCSFLSHHYSLHNSSPLSLITSWTDSFNGFLARIVSHCYSSNLVQEDWPPSLYLPVKLAIDIPSRDWNDPVVLERKRVQAMLCALPNCDEKLSESNLSSEPEAALVFLEDLLNQSDLCGESLHRLTAQLRLEVAYNYSLSQCWLSVMESISRAKIEMLPESQVLCHPIPPEFSQVHFPAEQLIQYVPRKRRNPYKELSLDSDVLELHSSSKRSIRAKAAEMERLLSRVLDDST